LLFKTTPILCLPLLKLNYSKKSLILRIDCILRLIFFFIEKLFEEKEKIVFIGRMLLEI